MGEISETATNSCHTIVSPKCCWSRLSQIVCEPPLNKSAFNYCFCYLKCMTSVWKWHLLWLAGLHISLKGSWNQNSLDLLTYMKSLYYIKTSCKFQNFLVTLKTAFIESSLPKQQLVECSTLWPCVHQTIFSQLKTPGTLLKTPSCERFFFFFQLDALVAMIRNIR